MWNFFKILFEKGYFLSWLNLISYTLLFRILVQFVFSTDFQEIKKWILFGLFIGSSRKKNKKNAISAFKFKDKSKYFLQWSCCRKEKVTNQFSTGPGGGHKNFKCITFWKYMGGRTILLASFPTLFYTNLQFTFPRYLQQVKY